MHRKFFHRPCFLFCLSPHAKQRFMYAADIPHSFKPVEVGRLVWHHSVCPKPMSGQSMVPSDELDDDIVSNSQFHGRLICWFQCAKAFLYLFFLARNAFLRPRTRGEQRLHTGNLWRSFRIALLRTDWLVSEFLHFSIPPSLHLPLECSAVLQLTLNSSRRLFFF